MPTFRILATAGAALLATGLTSCQQPEVLELGARLELMVDDHLIESMDGVQRRLHHPVPGDVVFVHDAPWEGNASGYHTVFKDGDRYRMYYKALNYVLSDTTLVVADSGYVAYAESDDGIHWNRPTLGLIDFHGSMDNNLVWYGPGWHGFSPFLDERPGVDAESRYKAVGAGPEGLMAMRSADGIRWTLAQEGPVITDGAFDSQSVAFWDGARGEYRVYFRDGRDSRRDVRTATSQDFLTWSEATWLSYPGAPPEQLYTSQIKPYPWAPHLLIGLPTRYVERGPIEEMDGLPNPGGRRARAAVRTRYGTAVTDALLMTSRDGVTFHRWGEAFLRPGPPGADAWAYGDQYIANQVVRTRAAVPGAPDELSVYATEAYWSEGGTKVRRYTLRMDGFASLQAPAGGGEVLTRPFRFTGDELVLNYATSGAGGIKVEIVTASGEVVDGFSMAESVELYGDEIEGVVRWTGGNRLADLARTPVRLRLVMRDADLYALAFREAAASRRR